MGGSSNASVRIQKKKKKIEMQTAKKDRYNFLCKNGSVTKRYAKNSLATSIAMQYIFCLRNR